MLGALKSQIGQGNGFKSFAINIEDPNLQVQLEKLAMDSNTDDGYEALKTTCGMDVISAHGVPPLLAGIHLAGKMAATNELPNALMAFQVLVIGPAQNNFRKVLARTLGAKETGLGLSYADFRFNRITEDLDLAMMNTVAGMKQTLPEAQAQGRDLSAGMKK